MNALTIDTADAGEPIKETIKRINEARTSIDAVVYKCNHRGVCKALAAAAQRGVLVRLLIDAQLLPKKRKGSCLRSLRKYATVRLLVWPHGKLHAKFTVVDRTRVLCGSYNWTEPTKGGRLELMLGFADDRVVGGRFSDLFNELWRSSGGVV